MLAAGGQTAAKAGTHSKLSEMICVPKAEGSLKVTRSLGDVPHHANDAVSHVPSIAHPYSHPHPHSKPNPNPNPNPTLTPTPTLTLTLTLP